MPKLIDNKKVSLTNWQKISKAQHCLGNAFCRQLFDDSDKVLIFPLYSPDDIQVAMQTIADMYDIKIQFQEK